MQTVGFSPASTIPSNTLFRLTLSSHWYDLANRFPGAAQALYGSLYQLAQIIPTTRLVVVHGDKSAIIDANLKVEETGSDLLNALDNAGQRFAFVSKVEMLTGDSRFDSSSDNGVAERDTQQQDANRAAENSGIVHTLMNELGKAGNVVKWGGIGIAILAVVYFGSPYLSRRK